MRFGDVTTDYLDDPLAFSGATAAIARGVATRLRGINAASATGGAAAALIDGLTAGLVHEVRLRRIVES